MRGFCTPVGPLLVLSRLGDEYLVTGALCIAPATNGEDVLLPSLGYINLHLSLSCVCGVLSLKMSTAQIPELIWTDLSEDLEAFARSGT